MCAYLIYCNKTDALNGVLESPCDCMQKHRGILELDLMSTVVWIGIYIRYGGGK